MPSVTSQRAEFQNRVFQAHFLRVKKKNKNRLVLIFWEFTDSIIAGKHRVLHNGGTYTTVANTNKTLQGLANERLARCWKTKHQSVKGITRADFGPFIIRKKNIRKQIKLSHIPLLGKLFDIARKAPAGAEESRAHESDAGATRATDYKETMCVSHTRTHNTLRRAFTHDAPLPKSTLDFLFSSCI